MDSLTKHIQLIHSKNNQHKTVLYSNNPLYYNVVTRVNYNTLLLWIEHINPIIKQKQIPNLLPITKPNWMHFIKSYRRELENKLK